MEAPSGLTLAEPAPRASRELELTIWPAARNGYLAAELMAAIGEPDFVTLAYDDAGGVAIAPAEGRGVATRAVHKRPSAGGSTYVPIAMIRALARGERSISPIRVIFDAEDRRGKFIIGKVSEVQGGEINDK